MKSGKESIVELYRPESSLSTEVRRLLHNSIRRAGGKLPISILVTSAAMGEGKSTVSSFLAIAAALHKKLRVLLIDADLRRPSVHKLFNLDIAPGITDLKTLGKEWIDVARQVRGVAGLSVLTVGGSDELPTEQIESGIVQQVVASANKWFDLIIADSPPMLPVNDALQLAPAFDGVLLVTKAGETSKDLTKTAIDTLKRHDIALLGVTLNNVLGVMPHYYGHYSYTRAEE